LRGPTYPDPALIGGFGIIKIQMQNYTTLESTCKEAHKNNLEQLRSKLGPFTTKKAERFRRYSSGNRGFTSLGNRKNLQSKFIRNYSTSSICDNYILNSYLTGLIESSGTFVIQNTKPKDKPGLPKLLVLFNLNDYFLVKELISITGIGVLCKLKSSII
jgi:hypothetical protein